MDADKQPVAKASGELTLYLSAQKKVLHLPAIEIDAGHYRFDLPQIVTGSLPVRVEFALQGARISRQLLINF